jgi:hypothetical protein
MEPECREPACARYHFAPGLQLNATEERHSWRVEDGHQLIARIQVLYGEGTVTGTLHAVRFGSLVDAATLEVRLHGGRATVRVCWER